MTVAVAVAALEMNPVPALDFKNNYAFISIDHSKRREGFYGSHYTR